MIKEMTNTDNKATNNKVSDGANNKTNEKTHAKSNKKNYDVIELTEVTKAFDTKIISNKLNLSIRAHEFLVIIGLSGEGKSVLLKQIIGLISPDSGSVRINDVEITKTTKREQREILKTCGYVFQFAALLDSLTIFENVGVTLLEQGQSIKQVRPLVIEKLASVGLNKDVLSKYPTQLSGGMKKRVGLARTLMQNPEILIYDEPTTGLDPISTKMIHELMKKTHIDNKATTVAISHDAGIFKYADRVAMLYQGKIIYIGRAQDIWESENPHVYQFIRGLSEGPISQK